MAEGLKNRIERLERNSTAVNHGCPSCGRVPLHAFKATEGGPLACMCGAAMKTRPDRMMKIMVGVAGSEL